jgi:hypothetical protein
MPERPESCPACTGSRYCAPLRCYCAHNECPALYTPLPAIRDDVATTIPSPSSASWDNREGATWIDQL